MCNPSDTLTKSASAHLCDHLQKQHDMSTVYGQSICMYIYMLYIYIYQIYSNIYIYIYYIEKIICIYMHYNVYTIYLDAPLEFLSGNQTQSPISTEMPLRSPNTKSLPCRYECMVVMCETQLCRTGSLLLRAIRMM